MQGGHGVQLLRGSPVGEQVLLGLGINLECEGGGGEFFLPVRHLRTFKVAQNLEQLGYDLVRLLFAHRAFVGIVNQLAQRRERTEDGGDFGAHRGACVDEWGGQVGKRPEQIRRPGNLHPLLDLAEHNRANGDADKGLNQGVALADVAGQGEAGLLGDDGVVEARFAQFQHAARRQKGGDHAEVLDVVPGRVEIL